MRGSGHVWVLLLVAACGEDSDAGNAASGTSGLVGNGTSVCAWSRDQAVCVGSNAHGLIGDGTRITRNSPVQLSVPDGARQVVMGRSHACALSGKGRIYCWGSGAREQLGTSGLRTALSPRLVEGISNVAGLAAAGDFTCAWTRSGRVACWGALTPGDGSSSELKEFHFLDELQSVKAVTVGPGHACALIGKQDVWCFGPDAPRKPGTSVETPTFVFSAALPIKELSAGATVTYMHAEDGTLFWVRAGNTYAPKLSWSARSIRASENYTCALLDDQLMKCWEGYPSAQPYHYSTKNFKNAIALGATSTAGCALLSDSSVQCMPSLASPPACPNDSADPGGAHRVLRFATLQFVEPSTLTQGVQQLVDVAVSDQRFNVVVTLDQTADGSLRASVGPARALLQGTFERWSPQAYPSIDFEARIEEEMLHAGPAPSRLLIPVQNIDNRVMLDIVLPLRSLQIEDGILAEDRRCVPNLGAAVTPNVRAFITVEEGMSQMLNNVWGWDMSLCDLLAGNADLCTSSPRDSWSSVPNALCDGAGCIVDPGDGSVCAVESCNAWQVRARFSATAIAIADADAAPLLKGDRGPVQPGTPP
jgi:hypothetical protein